MEDLHTKWKRITEKNHKEYDKADCRICGDCKYCGETWSTWLKPGKKWCRIMCVMTRHSMPVGNCKHYTVEDTNGKEK